MNVFETLKSKFRSEERCEETSCKDDESIAAARAANPKGVFPPSRSEIGRAAWQYIHAMAALYDPDAPPQRLDPNFGRKPAKDFPSALPTAKNPASRNPPAVTQKDDMQDWLVSFVELYPCGHCSTAFIDIIAKHEPNLDTRDDFVKWWVWSHNEVRRDLSQKIIVRDPYSIASRGGPPGSGTALPGVPQPFDPTINMAVKEFDQMLDAHRRGENYMSAFFGRK